MRSFGGAAPQARGRRPRRPLVLCEMRIPSFRRRDGGVPRGPGGAPHNSVLVAALLLLLACLPLHAQAPAFPQRVQFVIDAYAHPKTAGPLGYLNIAAKLKLHEDAALCSRRLEELLEAGPTGDMFWMFPITAVAYLDQGQLSDSARQALRRSFRTYMPYRGDTENHWLLYNTSLYLMAQLWLDQDGDQWYTGKSSTENMREAAATIAPS